MKKLYKAPEIESYDIEPFCDDEGLSDNPGEVTPNGNESRIFDRSDVGNDDNSNVLWDN